MNGIIKLGLPDHIRIVIKDTHASIDFLTSTFSLDSWEIRDFVQGKEDLIVGEPFYPKNCFY